MFSNNGGVLSDREICFLSEIPRHVAEYEIKDFAKYAEFKKSLYYRNRTKEFSNDTALCLLGSDPSFHPSESTSGLKPLKFYHDYFRGCEVDEVRREWKYWQPMITPFEPSLVREREVRLGTGGIYLQKVISYGVSSYGYDIRSSRQFKIFTNVNGSMLDPKNFDNNAFVEVEADEVIIPPHSFILTRSEERFFIPRDIITICLGKCLAGNTLISDAETGKIMQMKDTADIRMIDSLNTGNQLIQKQRSLGLINNGIKPTKKLITKLGNEITATASHPFRTWGGWTKLSDLRPGDRIAVARRESLVGRTKLSQQEAMLLGFMTADGQCDVNGSSPVFTKVETAVMDAFKNAATSFGFVYSQRDEHSVRLVNKIGRGGVMAKNCAYTWLVTHGLAEKSKNKTIPLAIQTGTKETITNYLQALITCDGSFYVSRNKKVGFLCYYTTSKLLAQQTQILLRRLGLFFKLRKQNKRLNGKVFEMFTLITTSVSEINAFHNQIGFIKGSEKDIKLSSWIKENTVSIKSNFDTLPIEAWQDVKRILARLKIPLHTSGVVATKNSISLKPLKELAKKIPDSDLLCLANPDVVWDTVKSIEDDVEQEVFDYTVPAFSNFVANGIIVHNSTYARLGLVPGVTPFEPEWEGYATLEFSNTTSLPMKFYAGEGCAQILFLRASQTCKTSYADRSGKYNNQAPEPVVSKV